MSYNPANKQAKVALLIDADNVSSRNLKEIMSHTQNMGELIVKRVYGNWAKPVLASWSKVVANHGLVAVQVFDHITGKNCSDIAIVIDAIELQYTKNIDIFVLVTSDSDFTGLANRLVENNKTVIGFGETKAPKSLINSCTEFHFLFLEESHETHQNPLPKPTVKPRYYHDKKYSNPNDDQELTNYIRHVINKKADERGYLNTALLGNSLKTHATLDVGKYGYAKIGDLLKTLDEFEVFIEGESTQMIRKRETATSQNSITDITALDTTTLTNAISNAIVEYQNNEGWVGINKIALYLQQNHGILGNINYQVLLNLIGKIPVFRMEKRGEYWYVKDKRTNEEQSAQQDDNKIDAQQLRHDEHLIKAITQAITNCAVNGWAKVIDIGAELRELGYSAKNYQYKNLTEMLKALDLFDYKSIDNMTCFQAPIVQKKPAQGKIEYGEMEYIDDTVEDDDKDNKVIDDKQLITDDNLTVNAVEDNDNGDNTYDERHDISLELVEAFHDIDEEEEEIDVSALIIEAINKNQTQDGWATIGDIGKYMRDEIGIKISDYGYRNFGELIAELEEFEIKKQGRKVFARVR